jgi:hypothetical protein
MPERCPCAVRPETDSQPRVPSHARPAQALDVLPPRGLRPARRDGGGPHRLAGPGTPEGRCLGHRRHGGLRDRPRGPVDRHGAGLGRLRGVGLPHGRVGPPHRARRRGDGRHGLGPGQRRTDLGAAAQHLRHRHEDHEFRHRRAHGPGARQRHPGRDYAAPRRHGRSRPDHRRQQARRHRPRQRPGDAGRRPRRPHGPGQLQPRWPR